MGEPGEFSVPLEVAARTVGGEVIPPFTVRVSGEMVSGVSATPSVLTFGQLEYGAVETVRLLLRARSNELALVSAVTDCQSVTMSVYESTDHANTWVVAITFAAVDLGDQAFDVNIFYEFARASDHVPDGMIVVPVTALVHGNASIASESD